MPIPVMAFMFRFRLKRSSYCIALQMDLLAKIINLEQPPEFFPDFIPVISPGIFYYQQAIHNFLWDIKVLINHAIVCKYVQDATSSVVIVSFYYA